jgi:DNA-binding MarR family transcriptional regulator
MAKIQSLKKKELEERIQIFKIILVMGNAGDALTKLRERELRKYGITPEQAGALICIHLLKNNATPTELSKWLFREANTLSYLLKRMHNMGLINRKTDSKKKSLSRISLTKKGYEAYSHAIEFNSIAFISQVLSKEKRNQLWSLLKILRNHASKNLGRDVNHYSDIIDKQLLIDETSAPK